MDPVGAARLDGLVTAREAMVGGLLLPHLPFCPSSSLPVALPISPALPLSPVLSSHSPSSALNCSRPFAPIYTSALPRASSRLGSHFLWKSEASAESAWSLSLCDLYRALVIGIFTGVP